jgi:four helix bundle protein
MTSQTRRASVSIGANLAEGRVVAETRTLRVCCTSPIGAASEWEDPLLLPRDLERMETSGYQAFLVTLWRSNGC